MKSAQQKFNEYLDECRTTSDSVRAFVNVSADRHNGYAHAAGYLQSLVGDLIAELPRARREQVREQLDRDVQKMKNEMLMDTIKEA